MATIFTRIFEGEIPGTFVWRDERCVAFMSINPLTHGHTLVAPIEEIDHWIDVAPDLSAHLFEVARIIGGAQRAAFSPARIGLIVAGFEVPHAHIHVVPTNRESELQFSNAAASVDRQELQAAAAAIRAALRDAGHDQEVAT